MPHKKAPVSYGAIPTDDGAGEIELTNRVPDSEVLKKSQAELAAELKKQQMTESRMLTCFQIFLTIAFMVGYTMLFESMGWLKSIDVDALAQHPAIGVNSVNSLPEAFIVDKKSGAMSYPDMVFFQFPDDNIKWFGEHKGSWVWMHGVLYAALPPALLHGMSAGMMDPVFYTTMVPVPKPDSECLKYGGDRTQCLHELVGNQVDLKKRLPADGFFAFITKQKMDVWKLKLNVGLGRGLFLEPKDVAEISSPVLGLTIVTGIIVLLLTLAACWSCFQYASNKQKSYLKQYIAQGLFLHDEEQNEKYDQIQAEEIMKVGGDDECAIEMDSDDQESSDEDDPDPMGLRSPTASSHDDEKTAKRRKERMEVRLMEHISQEQGVLHFVTNQVHGTAGQQQMPAMSGSAMEAVGPTVCDQCYVRAKTTICHIIVMALSTLPVTMLRFFFRQGIDKFGYLGVDTGIIAHGLIRQVIQFAFLLSFALFHILLLGLILHYFFHEFDGSRFPWLKRFTRSDFAKWLLVQWTGFSYIQATCFFMSMFVVVLFSLNAAGGLMLHFFTNMLAVTALLGTGAAAYANFRSIEAVLELVHSEIRSAGVIMESIKVGLTQRIIELALGEQTLVKDKAQLRDTLILKGMLPENTEGTSAWNASVASHLSGQLDDDDQAMLDSIESRQRSMVAGFNAVDKENGNGNGSVTREELELTFGRISDEEWYHFDEDGGGDVTMQEWQDAKMKWVQKSVLMVRSAFEHCVEAELKKQGFGKERIIKYSGIGLVAISMVLLLFYFLMASANAFGAMAAMVSSAISAAAFAFMNMGKKKAGNIDPNVKKGIVQLNKALQITVRDAVTDLAKILRFFPALMKIMDRAITNAETLLKKEYKDKPKETQKYATDMIKIARDAFKARRVANEQLIIEANETALVANPTSPSSWKQLGQHGTGAMSIGGKKYTPKECLAMADKLKNEKLQVEQEDDQM